MSRWHDRACRAPEVFIDGRTPTCRACNAQPDIPNLILRRDSGNAPWKAPPDEPQGHMSLWWPTCVPYRDTTVASEQQREVAKQHDTDIADPDSTASFQSHVYARSLGADEIRLACLSDRSYGDDILHVDLEIWAEDGCPEYETTSYVWAGEDGDNALRWPLFIGDYWDVLLQTKNCWHLLQYLRPRRGIRLVWLDAICIDQMSFAERNTQVAKMASIYSRCSRVGMYLGPTVSWHHAHSAGAVTHPPRRSLDKLHAQLVNEAQMNLQTLLRLRYYTRVWVIQELILAPCVLITAFGVDFVASSFGVDSLIRSSPGLTWEITNAPWLHFMAKGGFPTGRSLFDILQITWQSRATDTRDKIFGVLGLVPQENEAVSLEPDYSISTLHTFVGVFAYFIIKLRLIEVLVAAVGSKPGHLQASWIPDWCDDSVLPDIKNALKLTQDLLFENASDLDEAIITVRAAARAYYRSIMFRRGISFSSDDFPHYDIRLQSATYSQTSAAKATNRNLAGPFMSWNDDACIDL